MLFAFMGQVRERGRQERGDYNSSMLRMGHSADILGLSWKGLCSFHNVLLAIFRARLFVLWFLLQGLRVWLLCTLCCGCPAHVSWTGELPKRATTLLRHNFTPPVDSSLDCSPECPLECYDDPSLKSSLDSSLHGSLHGSLDRPHDRSLMCYPGRSLHRTRHCFVSTPLSKKQQLGV